MTKIFSIGRLVMDLGWAPSVARKRFLARYTVLIEQQATRFRQYA